MPIILMTGDFCMTELKYIAFPGLTTDGRIFRDLKVNQVVEYIDPSEGDSLYEFAQRMSFKVPVQPNTVFVGFDFGGAIALELAKIPKFRENLAGIVLISSVTEPSQISSDIRRQATELPYLPNLAVSLAIKGRSNVLARREGLRLADVDLVEEMAADTCFDFFRWAVTAALDWKGVSTGQDVPGVPILRVNGSDNRLVPATPGTLDYSVRGAGHFSPLSHARAIQDVIDTWSKKLARAA